MPISPPVVTFSSIDADEEPSLVASGAAPPDQWQAGRAERIRRLEATLDVTARLRLRLRQQRRTQSQSQQEHDYGDMLDSEGEDDNNNGSSSGGDDGNTCSSETSSLFYSEGQPLLCTYYQPPDAPTVTTPGTVFSGYGSIGNAASRMPPPKTDEQYLPWGVRIWNNLRQNVFVCSDCVCGCGGRRSKDTRPED